jgi:ribonuclease BN (tRNA processing enzyme)
MTPTRIVFLGTGGALNEERYQASILVVAGTTRVLLDTGGGLGVVRRLRAAGQDPSAIGHIFLSHRHLDHSGGLEPLLLWVGIGAQRTGRPPDPVRLYTSASTGEALRIALTALDASGAQRFGDRLEWVACEPGAPQVLSSGCTLTLVPVEHPPYGGGAGGCVLDVSGVRIAYSGDTRPCAALAEAARGADLLLHEASSLEDLSELMHEVGHSTAKDAAHIAKTAGARALGLVHLSPTDAVPTADLLAEARAEAPGLDIFAAHDGLVWTAPAGD